MICKKCQKEIDSDSKFCEFCGGQVARKEFETDNYQVESHGSSNEAGFQRKTIKSRLWDFSKKLILVLCVFILSTAFIAETYNLDEESMVFAVLITILITFVYTRIAKRFSL